MRKFILFIVLIINGLSLFGQPVLTINSLDTFIHAVPETVFFDDNIGDKTIENLQQAPSVFFIKMFVLVFKRLEFSLNDLNLLQK